MLMTHVVPESWCDLQNKVAQYFNEAGYKAISPHTIATARGKAEIDVYVEAPLELAKIVICECKFWETPIPQEKVHAFRTVVSDSGASLGIIISKKGFQKGAYEAACCTNVLLKTWSEFLELIQEKWITAKLRALKKLRAPLSVFLDPLDVPTNLLEKSKQDEYINLVNKYIEISQTCWTLKRSMFSNPDSIPLFKGMKSIEEYIGYLSKAVEDALFCFEELFSSFQIEEYKFDLPDEYVYAYLE